VEEMAGLRGPPTMPRFRDIFYINLQKCRGDIDMSISTQVSAYISEETKAQVEAYVKSHGVKKGYLIEEALQHHLQALREIPEDLIIPSRLVLTSAAMGCKGFGIY
jgi:hypothetical protein